MLNQTEIDRLQSLLKNQPVLEVVKKVFAETIEKTNPSTTIADDDALLGQKYRAFLTAKDVINKCFTELLSYEKAEGKEKKFNKEI